MNSDRNPALVDILNAQDKKLYPSDAVAAIIIVRGEGYLMQYRDPIPDIFYPGHWGLFGGASEAGENEVAALKRELEEELALPPDIVEPVRFLSTRFQFDFLAGGAVTRTIFTLEIDAAVVPRLRLSEGSAMAVLTWREALDPERPVTPYDSFAVWSHHNRDRISQERLTYRRGRPGE